MSKQLTIGLVVPFSTDKVPDEGPMMYPGVKFIPRAVGVRALTPEGYDAAWNAILPAAKQLAKEGVDAIMVIGTSLTFYRGPDVEKGGQTHDGRSFDNIEQYKALLLEDKDQLARSLTQKLLIYATGADIQFADREVVEQIVATLRKKNYGLRTLVHEVVQSRVFLNK